MIYSIRSFLLTNILVGLAVIFLLAMMVNYGFVQREIRRNFDDQLVFTANSVQSFIKSEKNKADLGSQLQNFSERLSDKVLHASKRKILVHYELQILNQKGQVVFATPEIPAEPLKARLGFSSVMSQGIFWRTFTLRDPSYTIVVAQQHDFRVSIENQVAESMVLVIIFAVPFFVLFVLLIVHYLMYCLSRIGNEIRRHIPGKMNPINIELVPKEIRSVVNSLNTLFNNLTDALNREKNFAEDAGHELQTPLAAIKVYTQLALNANSPLEREAALKNILQSVDRSSHGVHQLLILSRILANVYSLKPEEVNLHQEASEVIAKLTPFALSKNINVELICNTKTPQLISANSNAIRILLENLVDNAIRYNTGGGFVRVNIESFVGAIIIRVIDNGPGIPCELREKVFDRFYRIIGTKEMGSGLGLSIVYQIAKLYDAEIKLETPTSGTGLEVQVTFRK